MAEKAHLAQLLKDREGSESWDLWRAAHDEITPDLSGLNLSHMNLSGLNFSGTNFTGTNLRWAYLIGASLVGAHFIRADLTGAQLSNADLIGANLAHACLYTAYLHRADLSGTDFSGANLSLALLTQANLSMANFSRANLSGANLMGAILLDTDLSGANLTGAILETAVLVEANLKKADLTGCQIFGIAAWKIQLEGARQTNLVITPNSEPTVTVDNLEVAQFIYLLLHNEKIREVIDTVTAKAVLILGRFTPERKAVLDAIREELRRRNYLPILFDFEKPASRDLTETISTLAHMAWFVTADLTEPSSLPKELEAIVPTLAVPIQPVLEGATRPYSMFQDYWKYHWVLKVYRYESLEGLIASLGDGVIAPAEVKVQELEKTRKAIAEELLKQRPI